MHRVSILECRFIAAASVLLFLIMGVEPASAQHMEAASPGDFRATSRLGVGYVINAPHMFVGVSAYALAGRWGGVGIYADGKFGTDSPKDRPGYIPDLTVARVEDELGDRFFREEDEWRSFNLALLRPLSPELMVYAGAGHARRLRYREYIDQNRERGVSGFYWVRNEEESGGEVNLLGGVFFRIGPALALQFGVESAPRGMTVGASYSAPFGF